MRVIRDPGQMQGYANELRAKGKTIAFVPTMGFFHEGHLELMRVGRKMADEVVVSIFVNPTQFGENEDLSAYPRDYERDENLAASVGVDTIFYPTPENMYPQSYDTYIKLEKLSAPLCGVSRPVHFRGVATVCTKLFNLVKPHWAIFGEKDRQQLMVIQQLVKDLHMELEVVPVPTWRESDGLAMSSRNAYLTESERPHATALHKALKHAEKMVESGVRDADTIIKEGKAILEATPMIRIDYMELRSARDLSKITGTLDEDAVLAVACYLGKARLIDNTVLRRKGTTKV